MAADDELYLFPKKELLILDIRKERVQRFQIRQGLKFVIEEIVHSRVLNLHIGDDSSGHRKDKCSGAIEQEALIGLASAAASELKGRLSISVPRHAMSVVRTCREVRKTPRCLARLRCGSANRFRAILVTLVCRCDLSGG